MPKGIGDVLESVRTKMVRTTREEDGPEDSVVSVDSDSSKDEINRLCLREVLFRRSCVRKKYFENKKQMIIIKMAEKIEKRSVAQ